MDIVEREYLKDPELKSENVKLLQDWLDTQPHLPKMTEQEVIWFLKSCYFSNEAAKITIDNYFTIKTICPDILRDRDPKSLFNYMDVVTFSISPKKAADGSSVVTVHLTDVNPEHFILNNHFKLFDMVTLVDLYKNGTHEGLRVCFDMKSATFGHIARMRIMSMKKFLYYLQEAMPIRLKGLHFFNVTPVVDKFLMIVKPFLKKEVIAMLHLHSSAEDMSNFVPLECLPIELGGNHQTLRELKDEMKKILMENEEFFARQDAQLVDETKRPGKPKIATEDFGVEGTFKKIEID